MPQVDFLIGKEKHDACSFIDEITACKHSLHRVQLARDNEISELHNEILRLKGNLPVIRRGVSLSELPETLSPRQPKDHPGLISFEPVAPSSLGDGESVAEQMVSTPQSLDRKVTSVTSKSDASAIVGSSAIVGLPSRHAHGTVKANVVHFRARSFNRYAKVMQDVMQGSTDPQNLVNMQTTFFRKNWHVHYDDLKDSFVENVAKVTDILLGILIFLSIIALFLQMQWQGHLSGQALGQHGEDGQWSHAKTVFDVLEYTFNSLFMLELIFQLFRQGPSMLLKLPNWLDATLVFLSSADLFIIRHLGHRSSTFNLVMFRIVRIARVVRVFRAFSFASHVQELRILLHAMKASFGAIVWSIVLLGIIVLSAGILMAQLMIDFIRDDSNDESLRRWCYDHFGDAVKASYTMFEATLSGGWPNYARPLVTKVNPLFACFWVPYVATVWFAMVRIIAALFLKHTMQAASSDDEKMVAEKTQQKQSWAKKLHRFFEAADTSGDGFLSAEEFKECLKKREARHALQVLELEMFEIAALFNVLEDGFGEISFDEFLGCAMRLKGHARSVDSVAILHEQHKLSQMMQDCHEALLRLTQACDKLPA